MDSIVGSLIIRPLWLPLYGISGVLKPHDLCEINLEREGSVMILTVKIACEVEGEFPRDTEKMKVFLGGALADEALSHRISIGENADEDDEWESALWLGGIEVIDIQREEGE